MLLNRKTVWAVGPSRRRFDFAQRLLRMSGSVPVHPAHGEEGLSLAKARLEPGSADDPEDVAFLHDQQVLAIELDLGAGPFAEQDFVAGLDVQRSDGAVLAARAAADGDDLPLLRLFLRGVGDDDAAGRLFLGLKAANQHS